MKVRLLNFLPILDSMCAQRQTTKKKYDCFISIIWSNDAKLIDFYIQV